MDLLVKNARLLVLKIILRTINARFSSSLYFFLFIPHKCILFIQWLTNAYTYLLTIHKCIAILNPLD